MNSDSIRQIFSITYVADSSFHAQSKGILIEDPRNSRQLAVFGPRPCHESIMIFKKFEDAKPISWTSRRPAQLHASKKLSTNGTLVSSLPFKSFPRLQVGTGDFTGDLLIFNLFGQSFIGQNEGHGIKVSVPKGAAHSSDRLRGPWLIVSLDNPLVLAGMAPSPSLETPIASAEVCYFVFDPHPVKFVDLAATEHVPDVAPFEYLQTIIREVVERAQSENATVGPEDVSLMIDSLGSLAQAKRDFDNGLRGLVLENIYPIPSLLVRIAGTSESVIVVASNLTWRDVRFCYYIECARMVAGSQFAMHSDYDGATFGFPATEELLRIEEMVYARLSIASQSIPVWPARTGFPSLTDREDGRSYWQGLSAFWRSGGGGHRYGMWRVSVVDNNEILFLEGDEGVMVTLVEHASWGYSWEWVAGIPVSWTRNAISPRCGPVGGTSTCHAIIKGVDVPLGSCVDLILQERSPFADDVLSSFNLCIARPAAEQLLAREGESK